MSTADPSVLYADGCAVGNQTGVVVLDWGQPQYQGGTYGTWDFANQFLSEADIEAAGKAFLDGYWACTSSPGAYMRLTLGTSNYHGATGSDHGRSWAQTVNDLNGWISSQGY